MTEAQTCSWWIEDSDYGSWETSCGHLFMLNDGSPYQNRMRWCCYCGKPLTEGASAKTFAAVAGRVK
jgi:hypothetical protein